MIKLTIHSKSESTSVIFNQQVITIGKGLSNAVDVPLTDENLQDIHLKILSQNNRYIALNYANDPFATLNDLPFGKKNLKNHDALQIGDVTINFEDFGTDSNCSEITNNDIKAPSTLIEIKEFSHSPKETKQINSSKSDSYAHHENSEQESVKKAALDLEALFREVDALDQEIDFSELPIKIKTSQTITENQSPPPAIVNDSAKEMDDSSQELELNTIYDVDDDVVQQEKDTIRKQSTEKETSGWNRVGFIIPLIIILVFSLALAIYLNIREQSNADKILAAEGVADVSMALAYAQVNHIKPQKQNWFDPEFLKNNLASVVSSDYPSLAHIDNQGHFNNCPYILRIYTSSDLDHFVILAQPAPSLLQWLIPNPTIMVDSRAMELRETNDLRFLNRLLVTNTLNSSNALEISALVKQGNLITLNSLMGQTSNQEFSPPKALGLVRPHAENYIYNAPRYYQFGEALMQNAIDLTQSKGNHHEILRLQQEMSELARFPDIILYSSQGLSEAIEGQKALAIIVPHSNFLTAYLHFSADGMVTSSHLLLNGNYSTLNSSSIESPLNKTPDSSINVYSSFTSKAGSLQKGEEKIDPNHPLFVELSSIAATRESLLKSISDKIHALFHEYNTYPTAEFKQKSQLLFQEYESADHEQTQKIITQLSHLYQEHANIPLDQFKRYLYATKLELFSNEDMHLPQELAKTEDIDNLTETFEEEISEEATPTIELTLKTAENANLTPEASKESHSEVIAGIETLSLPEPKIVVQENDLGGQMHHILQAENFEQLEIIVETITNQLTLTLLPDPDLLTAIENKLRIEAIARLGQLILFHQSILPRSPFQEQNRITVQHILNLIHFSGPMANGYLRHFDTQDEN